jgi:ankyrin repeat protein
MSWSSEIHKAAETGNLDEIKGLLANTPTLIEEKDENGHTPLLVAARGGQIEIAKYLVDKGADIKAVNARGNTALHLAAWAGNAALADYFIAKGIDINAKSPTGMTPLLYAVNMERPEVVKLLLTKGADINIADNNFGGTAIHWACNKNNQEIRELLLAAGADFNVVSPGDRSTPIFWATFIGNNDAVSFLLDHGVDINYALAGGWTPLLNAVRQGRYETVQLLLAKGADINGASSNGETPLNIAISSNNDSMAQFLINAGADINRPSQEGFVPLHFATMNGNLNMMKILLENGADIESATIGGVNSLNYAVQWGHAAAAQMLIDYGARIDTSKLNQDGCAPLRDAILAGYDSVFNLILNYNLDLNGKDDNYGRTVLHWAAINGNNLITGILLKHGAQINQKDSANCTPLYYATKYGHKDLAEFLMANGGKADNLIENYSNPIRSDLKPGEAQIWYLGNCGFAIRTAGHFLIFDYYNYGKNPANPRLANGHIEPAEIADQNVVVFVTHGHADHYDTSIFNWKNNIKNIEYIYGFNPSAPGQTPYSGPEYQYVGPHENKIIDDINVKTIAANDAGVGYLVNVDGLTIYHAGDHAGWAEGQRDGYMGEIDYLLGLTNNIDLAFLNATGCHSHDTTALAEGTLYTLNKLAPKIWIPTHGLNREYVYRSFIAKMDSVGGKVKAASIENRGDNFLYKISKMP